MAKSKKLTIEHIKKDNKKYEEKVKVVFDDGMYLHINRYFMTEKIDQMLESLGKTLSEMERMDIHFEDDKIFNFLMLHIFKFFSSLGEEIPDDLETKIIVFKELLKSDYCIKLAEAYDPNEIGKVMDRMQKNIETVIQAQDLQKEFKRQLFSKIGQLENGDIIRNMMFGEDNA